MAKNEQKVYELLTSEDERTFQYDKQLPSLPVPALEMTMKKYLSSIKPFVSEEEYKHTELLVNDFSTGIGKELHDLLVKRSQEKKNWLEEWWLKYAYLLGRKPLIPYSNTSGVHSLNLDYWFPSHEKAFHGLRLSMNQFRNVFNTCRIPHRGCDEIASHFKTIYEGDCPLHMIILCYGHIWCFTPFDTQGKLCTPYELEDQLHYINKLSHEAGIGQEIAGLTCDDRDKWAENYEWLLSLHPQNKKNLKLIESSLFVFVLDDHSPLNTEEAWWLSLCGTTNRWADKAINSIAYANGFNCSNNDHAPYDAMVSVIMCHYEYSVITEKFKSGFPWSKTVRQFPRPVKLEFIIDEDIHNSICRIKETNINHASNVSVCVGDVTIVGKNWFKSHKVHPDAFVQVALQLAYYQMYGRPAPTYETATTRQFFNGRTETMRSCTNEVVAFIQSMLDPEATKEKQKMKLLTAINTHIHLMGECEKNLGADRHLLGLYITALENDYPIHSLFSDPSFTKSGGGANFVLSTSTIGYYLSLGGVTAMVPNGYGCFYSMREEKLQCFVTTFNETGETSCKKLTDSFIDSIKKMKEVLIHPSSQL